MARGRGRERLRKLYRKKVILEKLKKLIEDEDKKKRLAETENEKEARGKRNRAIKEQIERYEAELCEIETAIAKADLTPLEHILIMLRYIEGLKWDKICEKMHTEDKYAPFRYERSTYMRAHRSAAEKIEGILESSRLA